MSVFLNFFRYNFEAISFLIFPFNENIILRFSITIIIILISILFYLRFKLLGKIFRRVVFFILFFYFLAASTYMLYDGRDNLSENKSYAASLCLSCIGIE